MIWLHHCWEAVAENQDSAGSLASSQMVMYAALSYNLHEAHISKQGKEQSSYYYFAEN